MTDIALTQQQVAARKQDPDRHHVKGGEGDKGEDVQDQSWGNELLILKQELWDNFQNKELQETGILIQSAQDPTRKTSPMTSYKIGCTNNMTRCLPITKKVAKTMQEDVDIQRMDINEDCSAKKYEMHDLLGPVLLLCIQLNCCSASVWRLARNIACIRGQESISKVASPVTCELIVLTSSCPELLPSVLLFIPSCIFVLRQELSFILDSLLLSQLVMSSLLWCFNSSNLVTQNLSLLLDSSDPVTHNLSLLLDCSVLVTNWEGGDTLFSLCCVFFDVLQGISGNWGTHLNNLATLCCQVFPCCCWGHSSPTIS